MDIGTIRGIGTAVVFIAFIGVVLWAYSSKRKKSFDEAANAPGFRGVVTAPIA